MLDALEKIGKDKSKFDVHSSGSGGATFVHLCKSV